MDNQYNAFLRAVIEAVTEFLPVSSTGHLFLFSYFFPFQGLGERSASFEDLFDIFIQSGAILSVLVLYHKKFWEEARKAYYFWFQKKEDGTGALFYQNIAIGIAPIVCLGFALKSVLDRIKESPYLLMILGVAWLLGGLVMVFVEQWREKAGEKEKHLNRKDAFLIGIFQCLALMPGVSRSAATIITARLLGLSKKDSAEFSFFLAVPVLLLAGVYKLYKHRSILNEETISILLFGSIVSFLLCYFVIKLFISFLRRRSFFAFGVYRIVLGALVILYFLRS
ncbi:undecaprenol kinase [Leptospira ryugenii]|uniref:Undecaprenyl-diphosphatase n=1 Tax=Leptospira ryugenii TaxID=1917863 RepID=A0A2P2DX44_9LEPT|nr:undecaprenyl-diphosphate phosphatase [Leptospira ryugenii]GBF49209.1 undecaprenol kinase [Leptospira ryugenii]